MTSYPSPTRSTTHISRVWLTGRCFAGEFILQRIPMILLKVPGLTPGEESVLEGERTLNPLKQSKALKAVPLVTACAASYNYTVSCWRPPITDIILLGFKRGWQQSSINASSLRWQAEIRGTDYWIHHRILAGPVDAAPWLSGSLV
jgi:hypothetical protein